MSESQIAWQYLELARQRLRLGDARGAIEPLRRLLSENPDFADAHALLAHVLYDCKRIYAARVECDIALALAPENAFSQLAGCYVSIGERKLAAAEAHAEAAIALDPDASEGYEARAAVADLRGDRAARRAALEQAIALDPDDARLLAHLGFLEFEVRNRARAEELARHALTSTPEDGAALCLMGYLLLDRGEIEAARDHALWALRSGSQTRALYLLAAIKARQSVWLGVWWRVNAWLNAQGTARTPFILVGGYLAYRVASTLALQGGSSQLSQIVDYGWYAICLYSWVAPSLFQQSVRRELAQVKLRKDF